MIDPNVHIEYFPNGIMEPIDFPNAGYKTMIFFSFELFFTLILIFCAYIVHRLT